jgi:hypothetical protein
VPEAEQYEFSSARDKKLEPFKGYFVKALTKCNLMIPVIDQINGGISTSADTSSSATKAAVTTVRSNTKDNWRLSIVARAGTVVDTKNLLGVDTRALDGYDASDVERPPHLRNYVAVSFPHRNWGEASGSFLHDIRRSAGIEQTWDMEVTTDMKNTDVVLTWPEIVDVPKDVDLKIIDVDGNVTKHMRSTGSYRFNSGETTTRRFKIVAGPAGVGRLVISGLNISQSKATGGATISYALSTDATTDVRIKKMTGETLRKLAAGKGVTRGISSISWNYQREDGQQTPAGSYILEVVATTPDGQVAKAFKPFVVAR